MGRKSADAVPAVSLVELAAAMARLAEDITSENAESVALREISLSVPLAAGDVASLQGRSPGISPELLPEGMREVLASVELAPDCRVVIRLTFDVGI